jgi:circadian clock protein KaiC
MEQIALTYGAERRRLRVYKMRGRAFHGGFHDFLIRTGGLEVFTRLVAGSHPQLQVEPRQAPSGIAELDQLVGGGLDHGTSTLVIGPSGSGKSTIAMQYVRAALERGEKTLFVSFDETERVFHDRARGLGWEFEREQEKGNFNFRQVDPAELSPGELSGSVSKAVQDGTRIVVLDSLTGYQHAMPEEQFLLLQMHEMLTYLNQQGVLTFVILAQSGMVGPMHSPVDMTYLSDTVLLLRFFEAEGEIRRAISVIKKRTGTHESSIREMRIDGGGIRVGEKLDGFRGVLTGTPVYGGRGKLLEERGD